LSLEPVQATALSIGALVVGWFVYDRLCKSPLGRHTRWLALAVYLLAVVFAFFFSLVFSGRAAFLHIGALLGTIMSANVFFVIIPNQKLVVADLIAGRMPDPALGEQAKQRSLHNTYLTLPVVLTMISGHYPILFEQPYAWQFAAAIIVGAGLVRHYYNLKDAGRSGNWIDWLLVCAAGIAISLVIVSMELANRNRSAAAGGEPVQLAEVVTVIQNRCVACHSATPSDGSFKGPPKGIAFDTPEEVERYAGQILRVAVETQAMPLANRTEMTPEERALVGRWALGAGAAH
jgi:uncharacterized membrane protein